MTNIEELQRALDIPGRNGRSFSIRHSANGSSGITVAPRGSPVRQAQGRPLSHCIEPSFWPAPTPMPECCSPLFRTPLANALRTKLRRLISNEPRLAERLEVHSIDAIGHRLFKSHLGQSQIVSQVKVLDS